MEWLEDRPLLSGPPTVTTLAATAITVGTATLNASVNPNGSSTDTSFQYSLDPTLPANIVTTLAGSPGEPGSAARFYGPAELAVDAAGNVYVADVVNCTVRKITPAGIVSTLAGSPGQEGSTDGTGSAALFNGPRGVAVDAVGNVYVADTDNDTIREITPAGVVTTLAGSPGQSGSTDGTGSAARFDGPNGVAVDAAGNLYVTDLLNYTIRKITPAGVVTTMAGSPGQDGITDGTGSAVRFDEPVGIAVDAAGNVYVGDADSIREITPAGVVTTLAGSGQRGSADGIGSAAQFSDPEGLSVDAAGNVYVADLGNETIRKITPAGVVTTLAGSPGQRAGIDGTGSAARFDGPDGVAVDAAGNVYVADGFGETIRELSIAAIPGQAGLTGTSAVAVTANLTGLSEATPYYFRAVGSNSAGPAVGTIATFTTASNLGKLDTTFGSQGTVHNTGTAEITSYPDGRFLTSQNNAYVTRYTPNGTIDPSFGGPSGALVPGGDVFEGNSAQDTAILPDGKVIAEVVPWSGMSPQLTRFNPDGSVDTSFGTGGLTAPINIVVSGQQVALQPSAGIRGDTLAVLPDGRILVAGSVAGDGGEHLGIAMLLPNGTLDPSFNGNGTLYVGPDAGATFQPNYAVDIAVDQNEILLFGYWGDGGARLYAINFDGSTDTSFGTNGEINLPAFDNRPAFALEPDGNILLAYFDGESQTVADGPGNEDLFQYDSAGAPDASFGTDGQVTVSGLYNPQLDNDVALEPDGKIVIIDDDPYSAGGAQPAIERLNSDGTVDASFGVGGVTTSLPPSSQQYTGLSGITTQPLGRILAFGGRGEVFGVVGDPVVGFGAATTYTSPSGVLSAVYDVSETAGTATITLEREGDLSQPLSVPFSTDDSGGQAAINYTPVNTTVTFPAGSETTTESIPILNDPNASPPVDIPLQLGTPTGGASLGGYTVGDLQIDPVEGITITPTQLSSVMQGGAGTSFTIALNSVPTGTVTVPLSISSTNPAAQLSASSLVFTPANALTPQAVTVTAVGSSGAPGPAVIATVNVGLATSSDPKYNGLAGASATVGVYASATSSGAIEFAAANFTYVETAGKATITLNRLGGSQGSVSVFFVTSDGSSASSGKYTPLSGSLSFGPGVTTKSFSIALVDPGHNLQGDQIVDLTLSKPTGGATLGVISSATLTLQDPYTLEPGDLDPAFGIGGKLVLPNLATTPSSIIQQPDGKLLVAAATNESTVVLWRLGVDGQLDPTFGTGGIDQIPVPNARGIHQVAIDWQGRIVLLVSVNAQPPQTIELEVIRLKSDGSLDTSFGTNGVASTQLGANDVCALAIESDDSILIGGSFGATYLTGQFGLIHLDSAGNLDIGFGTGGLLGLLPGSDVATGLFQRPDGKWIVVGYYGNVVRLNSDFSVDTTFGAGGTGTPNIFGGNGDGNNYLLSAALQPDGKILAGGQFGLGFGIARLNADGSVDNSFGDQGLQSATFTAPDGNGLAPGCTSIVVEPDGTIVGIGYADDVGASIDYLTAEARLLPNGTFDPSFAENGQRAFGVSPDGHDGGLSKAIGLANGDVLVAVAADGEPTLAAIVTSTPKTVPTISWGNPADIVHGTALGSTQLDATASAVVNGNTVIVPGTFAYSPAAGTILNVVNGQSLSVTFTPGDTADYASAAKTVQINVTPATPTINWANPADITPGTALGPAQLDATASWVVGGQTMNVPGTFVYSPSAGTILSAGASQPLEVTFTPTDTTDYNSPPAAAVHINVKNPNQITPTINWSNPAPIIYGTALGSAQLDATASAVVNGSTVSVPGSFSYSSAGGTALSAGNGQVLSVTFMPTDAADYISVAKSVKIDVQQATPTINWTNPEPITYGTALSSTQLDATGFVQGTIAYTPAAGTILNAGVNQTLAATFTPTDSVDFLSVTAYAQIDVLPVPPPRAW